MYDTPLISDISGHSLFLGGMGGVGGVPDRDCIGLGDGAAVPFHH